MDTNDTSPFPLDTPTISILRRDYQASAAPNASPEFVKKYPTNRAIIDAVNNLLLETYHSYTGRARISGSDDLKRLLPPNTKDVHLAPLVRAISAMAINILLSLNSYKPKRWAYITFKTQQMMDTAMEQSIALQGHRLHTSAPNSSGHKPLLVNPNCSQIQEILSVLKSLQEDMASVRARIHALELADQRMSRLELHVLGHKQSNVFPPDPNDSSHMLVDNHQSTPLLYLYPKLF
ncbi:hypothetical protein RhiirC2_788491 [Rhizophagus irregularis]|uniref:Uncharacterized protein n=1 Tax=Rhizophagus irregularis TaxID=588596 RepID=A0A2N1MPZ9_9GLOM|nr:hypothetical protein RhiirC2_788491 [Rhizophagus irregularis]